MNDEHIKHFKQLMKRHPELYRSLQRAIREGCQGKNSVAAPIVVTHLQQADVWSECNEFCNLVGEQAMDSKLGIAVYLTLHKEDRWCMTQADWGDRPNPVRIYARPNNQ